MRKSFEPNQKVLLYTSRLRLFPGKLLTRWVGPYIVRKVFDHWEIEIEDPKNGFLSKVNGQRLKPFLEESFDKKFELEETLVDPVYPDD